MMFFLFGLLLAPQSQAHEFSFLKPGFESILLVRAQSPEDNSEVNNLAYRLEKLSAGCRLELDTQFTGICFLYLESAKLLFTPMDFAKNLAFLSEKCRLAGAAPMLESNVEAVAAIGRLDPNCLRRVQHEAEIQKYINEE